MGEELVPCSHGEVGVHAGKAGDEVVSPSSDHSFSWIRSLVLRWDQLEGEIGFRTKEMLEGVVDLVVEALEFRVFSMAMIIVEGVRVGLDE